MSSSDKKNPKNGAITKNIETLNLILLVAVTIIVIFNATSISNLSAVSSSPSGSVSIGSSGLSAIKTTSNSNAPNIIPTGIPAIYGKELGLSFNDVSASNPQKADATIKLMGDLDRKMTLTGADLDRYINILYKIENGISCEYCCGARSVIFEDGKPACGCAHSYAMRGLTKYLITEHGNEYTDEAILEELGKWKVLYFPTQMTQKAQILQDNGIDLNYINIASNKYRGIEKSAGNSGGGMVGGC